MNRGELADMIRPLLARHQPCTADQLSDLLEHEHGVELDGTALEPILRWLGSAGVKRYDTGLWGISDQVRQLESTIATSLSEVGAAHSAMTSKRSATHLRTIERLRSGLPPVEAVEELSIDYAGSLSTIQKTLKRTNGHGRWIMIRGQYGNGKTHFLQVFRSLALSHNYATCYLCADNGACALNHPARFIPSVLATMEIPERPGVGYGDLLREVLVTSEGRLWFRAALERWRVRGRQPFADAILLLDLLVSQTTAEPDEPPSSLLITRIIELSFGRSVAASGSTPETREVAYNLLLLAGDVVKRFGAEGLALLIDEAESVFTKLPTILSRAGALRVLSALCEAPRLESVVTVVAMTPDAYTMLRHEMESYAASRCHPVYEPMSRLRRNIADCSHGSVECKPPKGADLRKLLDKVRAFYLRGYPAAGLDTSTSQTEWEQFAGALQKINTTPRLLIRRAVDFLDTQRYRHQ